MTEKLTRKQPELSHSQFEDGGIEREEFSAQLDESFERFSSCLRDIVDGQKLINGASLLAFAWAEVEIGEKLGQLQRRRDAHLIFQDFSDELPPGCSVKDLNILARQIVRRGRALERLTLPVPISSRTRDSCLKEAIMPFANDRDECDREFERLDRMRTLERERLCRDWGCSFEEILEYFRDRRVRNIKAILVIEEISEENLAGK